MSHKQSNELFYPHYIMTDSEYGVWNYAGSVSHQTKVFQCGARAMATRFKSMSKSTASRRINGLIKSGWFDVIEPARRGNGGLWRPAKLRPLSSEEYQQRYSDVCKRAVDDVARAVKELDQCGEPTCSTGDAGQHHAVPLECAPVPVKNDPAPLITAPVPSQACTRPIAGTEIENKAEIKTKTETKNEVEAMKKCRPAYVGISEVCLSILEKPALNTPESQQVQIRPPEAAAISRAHIAAPSDVSDTSADKADGSLATSKAHIAAAGTHHPPPAAAISAAREYRADSTGSSPPPKAVFCCEPDLYQTITAKFGIRFNGHAGEWQDAVTGWEVSGEQLERILKNIGVDRKQAWDAWAQTEGARLFSGQTLENAGLRSKE